MGVFEQPQGALDVHLWPDNVQAWQCWQGVQTQWRVGMGGATGLDYAGVRAYLDEVQPDERRAVFVGICACERATLEVWAQQREREQSAPAAPVSGAFAEFVTATESVSDVVTDTVDATAEAVKRLESEYSYQVSEVQDRIEAIADVVNTLDDAIREIRGSIQQTSQLSQDAARATLQSILVKVQRGGDISAYADQIASASAVLADNDTRFYSSRVDFSRAQAQSAALLQYLSDAGAVQKQVAQEQIELLTGIYQTQVKSLTSGQSAGAVSAPSLPQLAVGTNYVPRDMVAVLHEGEAVVPKAFNPALFPMGSSELVAELQGVRRELSALRAESVATARATVKTAKVLERVIPDGDALAVRTAA